MKYLVILTDGCADYKIAELGNQTPLEKAYIPNMDFFANNGKLYYVNTVPPSLKPGSDVANLSVMGYDPLKYYTGRSPLEAASIGVDIKMSETTFRANLVTLSGEENYEEKTMLDYSAGEISTEEGNELMKAIAAELNCEDKQFYAGISYRNLFVWNNAPKKFNLTPPHDISDKKIKEYLPSDEVILDIMKKSEKILKNHPVNVKRREQGKNEATSLWIWGEGKKPAIADFYDLYKVKGSTISAVDLIKGIGKLAGMSVPNVEGATGNLHTNFKGKAEKAVEELKNGCDFVYVHIEAPDECGHQGDIEGKVKSLEIIDKDVVGYIKEKLDEMNEDYSFMIMPDHPTPISTKTHARGEVPCVVYTKGDNNNSGHRFTEDDAANYGIHVSDGHTMMGKFLKGEL